MRGYLTLHNQWTFVSTVGTLVRGRYFIHPDAVPGSGSTVTVEWTGYVTSAWTANILIYAGGSLDTMETAPTGTLVATLSQVVAGAAGAFKSTGTIPRPSSLTLIKVVSTTVSGSPTIYHTSLVLR